MKTTIAVTAGMAVAGGLLMAGPVGAVVSPTDSVTQFTFPSGLGEGLITVVQGPSGGESSYSLSGFAPREKYTLTVSARGCSASKGAVLAKQKFRTDSRGLGFGSMPVTSQAKPKSVSLTQGKRPLVCNPVPVRLPHPVAVAENASPKGLLAVSQTSEQWQIAVAVGGLSRSARYRFVGMQGGCAGAVIIDNPARSDRRGFVSLDVKRTPIREGRMMDAAGLVDVATGQPVFCQIL